MKVSLPRTTVVLLFAVISTAPCFAHHMAVVVSKQTNVSAVTSPQLGKIFRADTRKWPDGTAIQVVLHRSSNGEAVSLQHLNKMTAQRWQNWIAEHKDLLTLVDCDSDVLDYVAKTPGAVGLVDVRSVNDHVKVVRVDGKVPMEEGYLPH